jgi:UDP-glucose 4-epimerase
VYGLVVNVGSQEEISIKALAERIISVTKSKSKVRLIPYTQACPPGFEDMERRMPDLTRLHSPTGYRPKYCLEQILLDVIADVRGTIGIARSFGAMGRLSGAMNDWGVSSPSAERAHR